jgi:hypothetical protein
MGLGKSVCRTSDNCRRRDGARLLEARLKAPAFGRLYERTLLGAMAAALRAYADAQEGREPATRSELRNEGRPCRLRLDGFGD